jgi:hypothetical protein
MAIALAKSPSRKHERPVLPMPHSFTVWTRRVRFDPIFCKVSAIGRLPGDSFGFFRRRKICQLSLKRRIPALTGLGSPELHFFVFFVVQNLLWHSWLRAMHAMGDSWFSVFVFPGL